MFDKLEKLLIILRVIQSLRHQYHIELLESIWYHVISPCTMFELAGGCNLLTLMIQEDDRLGCILNDFLVVVVENHLTIMFKASYTW